MRNRTLGTGALVLGLVIALAAMAIGWALWSKVLTITGVVNTGSVHASFVRAFTDDDDKLDDASRDAGDTDECLDLGGVDIDGDGLTSCDPAASEDGIPDDLATGPGPEPRYDKDVARCDASISPTNPNVGHIVKRNVYPSYFCTAWFEIKNDGSIPVKLASVLVNNHFIIPSIPTPFDLNGDGRPDVEVHITGVQECFQIDPGQSVFMDVDQHILQDAPQGTVLTYTIRIQLNQWNEKCPPPAPVFDVVSTGISPQQATNLSAALGIPATEPTENGAFLYMDADRFQAIPMMPAADSAPNEDDMPTTAEAINFDALTKLQVPDPEDALARFGGALAQARLEPDPRTAIPMISHSMAEVTQEIPTELLPLQLMSVPLDTQVSYDFSLNGIPVVGPGHKIRGVMDGEGMFTQVIYAARTLREGKEMPLISMEAAQAKCMEMFEGQLNQGFDSFFDVFTELAYFAPPLEMAVDALYPHYQCGGTAMVGGEEVLLRNVLIPAVEDAPQVKLNVVVDGSFVSAQAEASGGTPPYTFCWSSAHVTFPPEDACSTSTIEYNVSSRDDLGGVIMETLNVLVTDANALTGTASESFEVAPQIIIIDHQTHISAGTEWIGDCGGLGGSAANAGGFASNFAAEYPVEFNWGNANAWERDFKDPSLGGDDSDWVDSTDIVFYTGHANGNGMGNFCSSVDDTFVHYNDALWGNGDLEWLVIAACGPLQTSSSGLSAHGRWFDAFGGLHMLLGYANVSADNTLEGTIFSQAILDRGFYGFILGGPLKIRQAWAWAASLTQSSSVTYAYMYVFNGSGVSNYNDRFWDHGSVGPDIPNPVGSVVVRSPS